MFGFDFDEIFNGFTKTDEYIARDSLILELLVDAGLITSEQVKNKFEHLEERIKEVHQMREEEVKKRADEAKDRLEKYKKEGVI